MLHGSPWMGGGGGLHLMAVLGVVTSLLEDLGEVVSRRHRKLA